ncbi:cell wall protein [Microbacterium horticulturae]|uniref:Cell wall protein n=1 Tax=Microbacterium horticulturae TaxID=3028316 RepID=A0ABY8C1T8_9MICO|nr:cell wall protein [Microbacterium sp. KACC 23027]WEG10416.1 cell wall protein [Microbacterium sp. KACC 23027]
MFRKSMAAMAVAALLALGGAQAAFADDTDGVTNDHGYTPVTTDTASLVGSSAVGTCENGAPWITYNLKMSDPDKTATSHTATLTLQSGSHSQTIPLGTLNAHDELSGKVLWPGAKIVNGVPVLWPGWTTDDNGKLVPTSGNFAWTRGNVTAIIEVNPSLKLTLSYPPETSACANPPAAASVTDNAGILAVTGLSVPVIPIAIGGGIVLLAGAGLLLARRRRHS